MATLHRRHHLHPRLIEAAIALNENRLDVAERILKPHLKEDPFDARDPDACRACGADRPPARCRDLVSARDRDCSGLYRRNNLALVLGGWDARPKHMAMLDDIFADEPEELGHWNLKAATLGRLGDFEQAIPFYEAVLQRTPKQPRV